MRLKFTLLFLCVSSVASFGQKGFDQKKKTPGTTPNTITTPFREVDGGNTPGARVGTKSRLIDPALIKNKVYRDSLDGTVIYIRRNSEKIPSKNLRRSFHQSGMAFLEEVKIQMKVKDPQSEFELTGQAEDELGYSHLRFQQKFNGVPVYGGEALLHSKNQGAVEFLNGRVFPTPKLSVKPGFGEKEAIEKAMSDLRNITIVQKSGMTGKFLEIEKDKAELMIMHHQQKERLVYHLTVKPNILERWVYFIDAQSGEVLDKYNHTCTLDGVFKTSAKDLNGVTQAFNMYQSGANYFMIDPSKPMFNASKSKLPDTPVGALWTIDAQNSRIDDDEMKLSHVVSGNGTTWNPTAVSAHINAGICYDYYRTKFNRNSLNGNGGSIISVINIADEDGKGMDNAYWNGQFMGYGNGRDGFKPLAGALDVAGHEMTHGVIENTAKLEYRNQSGALNESFADIFGVLIDKDDWTLGEDVVKKAVFPSGALRSMENPNQGGKSDPGYQPKNMSQYAFLKDTPSEDNGGVHINSGIPNHAFYLFTTASGMNRDKAEKVYYRALTTYLTRTSKFTDLRLAVVQSAKDLFGEGTEFTAAKAAFDAVGIADPNAGTSNPNPTTPTTPSTDIQVNPGTDSMVVFDPTDGSMYAGPFSSNGTFSVIANKLGCLGKPSVTDDGSFVYFVGADKNIYRVNLTQKTAPQKLSTDASWRNVAISKNGILLAALANTSDQYIYVFNLQTNKNVKFKLYNPTYSNGVNTGEVQYADSFEWDYSGENLIYDAFNEAKSLFGNIEYWDVGVLKAWDASANDFGSGTIDKIFSDLEEGENIGNPALAKTNSSIIAFDYFDSSDESYYILTANLETGDLKAVVENNDIGYPDYSKADKIIVYNALDNQQNIVNGIKIKADKISPDGNPETYFTDAKWAVWYAQGARTLPTKTGQTITFAGISDKQPSVSFDLSATASSSLPVQFSLVSGDAQISGKRVNLGKTPGKVSVKAFQIGDSKFTSASAEQTFCIIPPAPGLSESGDFLVASGGQLYQWYINNSPIGGQTTNNRFKKDFAGAYTVRAVTQDGCLSSPSNSFGIVALANEPTASALAFKAYPNPVKDYVEIELNNSDRFEKAWVMDMNARSLIESEEKKIGVQALPSGTYLIKVKTNKAEYMKKMVKE